MAKKKGTTDKRYAVDYRGLSLELLENSMDVPRIDDLLDHWAKKEKNFTTMGAQHRDSNPGSAEVSKRALPASAGKETQKEHAQKTKVSAVMASVDPKALFEGKPAGSVHAPPMEAVLTTTSNEKDSPPRLSPANTPNQQSAQQHATPPV